jgi:hypothetical protein
MALKTKARTAQYPLVAEFTWNFDDTMVDTSGVTRDFGSLAGGSSAATVYTFEVIPLPVGANVLSGELVVETTFDTAGYDVTVGDTAVTNRYLSSTDVKTAARTALVPTGYTGTGQNIVITVSTDDACTAGVATLRVTYVIDGRANEVNIA